MFDNPGFRVEPTVPASKPGNKIWRLHEFTIQLQKPHLLFLSGVTKTAGPLVWFDEV